MAGAPEGKMFFGTYIEFDEIKFEKDRQLHVLDKEDTDEIELGLTARIEAFEEKLDEIGVVAMLMGETDGLAIVVDEYTQEFEGVEARKNSEVHDGASAQIEAAMKILGLANKPDSKFYLSAYTDY